MALTRRFSDKVQNSRHENIDLTTAEKVQQVEWDKRGGLTNYTKTDLQTMIDNFIIAYTGEGKLLPKVPRHEVAFWGQRGVQEFSYDVFYAEKNIELALNPDTAIVALPSDYVNYVKVTYTDSSGNDRTVHPSRVVNAKQAILQDNSYNQLYDETGDVLLADQSEGISRFQDPSITSRSAGFARNYYYGSVGDSDYYEDYNNQYYGRDYGNDPQFENSNGTFVLDTYKGLIYFDSAFVKALESNEGYVSLRYVSDGLGENDDLETVFIPKLAEDAVYASMLYNLAKVRQATINVAALYKKEAKAKYNNTKIRLYNLKTEEMTQVLRGRAKWIKH